MFCKQRRQWITLAAGAVAVIANTRSAWADDTRDAHDASVIVDKARTAFDDVINSKGFESLHAGIKTAKGVMIFPSIIKGGVVVGASGGTGVLLVRDESGQASAPAFYTLGAVSIGLQVGGEAAEVVILINSRKGVDRLLTNAVKLGGDASIAMGPKGAGRQANVTADFVSYAKSKGAFIGVSVEGAVLDVRESLNRAYYGKAVTPVDILVKHEASNPHADALRETVAAAIR
jgi:SH3 domain-containing YSC84-like protein 1